MMALDRCGVELIFNSGRYPLLYLGRCTKPHAWVRSAHSAAVGKLDVVDRVHVAQGTARNGQTASEDACCVIAAVAKIVGERNLEAPIVTR